MRSRSVRILFVLFTCHSVSSFNIQQRPSGIMWDVEPHATPLWQTDWHAAAIKWLDFLDDVVPPVAAASPGLNSSACIPFWYDGKNVTRNGQTRPLLHWAIDVLDEVLVMAYRDSAEGSDGIIAHARPNLDYAATKGKGCVIAVEIACSVTTDKVTFCEEGAAHMEQELTKVVAAFSSHAAFRGVAVHDYKHWRAAGNTGHPTLPRSIFVWQTGDAVYAGEAQSNMLQFMRTHAVLWMRYILG